MRYESPPEPRGSAFARVLNGIAFGWALGALLLIYKLENRVERIEAQVEAIVRGDSIVGRVQR